MTAYKFGDVVLVPFPFTDQTITKQRPAVVISNAAYHHQARLDVILLAVTSQLRPVLGIGEAIVQEWKGAGLLKPSVLKPVITTIEQRLIIKTLGRLQEADRSALERVIATVIG